MSGHGEPSVSERGQGALCPHAGRRSGRGRPAAARERRQVGQGAVHEGLALGICAPRKVRRVTLQKKTFGGLEQGADRTGHSLNIWRLGRRRAREEERTEGVPERGASGVTASRRAPNTIGGVLFYTKALER